MCDAYPKMIHSDYVVYVDESGDHGLQNIDPTYPIFSLSFCVFRKADYADVVVPAFQKLKFDFWGHDAVVFHEHEIRKKKREFRILNDIKLNEEFLARLNDAIASSPFEVIASIIHKDRLVLKYQNPWNPYEIALKFCLERLLKLMLEKGQRGRTVFVVFECRGAKEDRELELEFLRICHQNMQWGWKNYDFSQVNFSAVFAKKPTNSTGLQLADLTARPIGLSMLRPKQENRAMETIRPKICNVKQFP